VKKAAFAFLFAFAVLALAVTVNAEPGSDWGPDTQLTTDVAADLNPSGGGIMQDTTGTVWFVWASNRMGNKDIWYRNSSDHGATWSSDTQLTADTAIDENPSITQTSDGKIWVVFHSWRSQNPDIYYMTSPDGGATWSNANQLTTDTNFDLNPSIAQLSDGTIFVAWQSDRIWVQDPDTGDMIPQDDIYYTTSLDGGATWTDETRLTTDPKDDSDPSVTQTTDGKIWIAFVSNRLDPRDIYYTTSLDGGATWTDETRLTTYSGDDWAPSITQTNDGKIWVMFHSRRDNNWDIYYKTTSNGGVDWTPDTRLTDDPNVDVVPSVTQTADGWIWVAFASLRTGNYDIWCKMRSPHDVAITSVTASVTWVLRNETVTILVEAKNEGDYSETFTVTVYANSTELNFTSVTVASGDTTTLTFSWNTTNVALGSYTMSAQASTVPDEIDTADNTLIDGTVKVKFLLGDVNGDGKVSLFDAMVVRGVFGSEPGDPNWISEADLNRDNIIDIYDALIIRSQYGKTQCSLAITSASGGTTDPSPRTYTYVEGTVVTVTAIPDSGYVFDRWELDGADVGVANPIDVTVDADRALLALFTPE